MAKGLAGVPTPSATELAKKWKLPLADISKRIAAGAKVEREHTTSAKQAAEIARDHINERPDYYEKVKKMEKSPIVKEESTTGGIAGLGITTGTPAIAPDNEYIDTNSMSYEDWNGAILKMIKDRHNKHLIDMGFTSYSPNDIQGNANRVVKESVLNELGDYVKDGMPGYEGTTGPIRAIRKNSMKERSLNERGKVPADMTDGSERGIYQEGHIGFGFPSDWSGDRVDRKVYGTKPKEKPESNEPGTGDTYERSKQGGRVKFAKKPTNSTVKKEELDMATIANRREVADSTKTKDVFNRMRTGTPRGVTDLTDRQNQQQQVNEISAEKVGKVHIRYLEQNKPVPPFVQRAFKKKWLESKVGRPPEKKKNVKEDVAATVQHMDAPQAGEYRQAAKSSSRVSLRGSTAHVKGASFQSGTGQARASFSSGAGQMKPTTTNVPFRGMRSVSNAKTTQGAGGQLKPTSTSGSSTFTQNSQSRSMNVGKAMGASKQTSPVVKGMSAAGQEASKKIVPKAASVMATVGKAARALSGPEGAAVAAAAEPLAKKMAASHKAGHQSFTPHGDEGEKASTVFARMKQPSQGRSISQYEKDVLTPKASETPKAPENPKVDAPTPPERPKFFSRGQAFGAARGEAGGGEGKFSYQSGSDSAPKEYQTNVTGEPYKPSSQLKQTSVKEETNMDTKELINEALDNILEDNLSAMKDNLQQALQEKAMEKLEERKKEIAAQYFAQ